MAERRTDSLAGPSASGLRRRLSPASVGGAAVLLSIGAKALSGRLADPDLWWHLKTGQIIVATHHIPAADPFSFTAAGKPWIVQEWGSEVIMHGFNAVFGLRGIVVWRALMLLAVYGLVARLIVREAGNSIGTWALVALVAYSGSQSWTERPNLHSFLLFVVTLALARRRDRHIWLFVPLAALWANLHGMVVLGIGLVGLFAATEGLKVALRWEGADRAWARRLGFVTAAGILASFLNPHGPRLLTHAYRLVRLVSGVVEEWASPNFREAAPLLFLALALLTLAALALSPRRADPTDVALACAFLALGLLAVRNLPVAAIVLGTVAARSLGPALEGAGARMRARRGAAPGAAPGAVGPSTADTVISGVALAAVIAVFCVLGARALPRSGSAADAIAPSFPAATIRLPRGEVRLLTRDDWAGLALYEGWPGTRVAYDTRLDFYGSEILGRYRRTIAGMEGAQKQLGAWCATHVLVSDTDGLTAVLSRSDRWRLATSERLARGRQALLFVPAGPRACDGPA